MSSIFQKIIRKPIFILIAINIVIGLFIFRDYGLSWDEPLFYDYGNALGYAYSPAQWFSGHFDLNNSYGPSGDDHKTRGPAYLFLAREFVYGVEKLGSDSASAWHLINFLFFQLGIYFLYRLSTRWIKPPAALLTAIFFATQPLLWGHAFINPKDPPFLTFFLASACLGFEMVDALAQNDKHIGLKIFLAAFVLGIATSIRVLGPLVGLLVFIYFLSKLKQINYQHAWRSFILYGVISVVIMFVTWPYLWERPIANFIDVFRLMSDNPTTLSVLFRGQIYHAGDLPRRYLPFMLAVTLTEPTLPLFAFGVIVGYWKLFRQKQNLIPITLVLSWFVILVAYVLIRRPSMYDGIRHFLFILPPLFIFIGFAIQFVFDQISVLWLRVFLGLLLILPGVNGIVQLHPYEYAYYNSFIGGTSGAFRNYETEYWLTCYKQAVEELDQKASTPINLFVKREAYIAATYANDNVHVYDLRGASPDQLTSGTYILVNTRTNEDHNTFKDAPIVLKVTRGDAIFCIVRRIP